MQKEERLVVVCQPSLNVFENRMAVVLALPPKVWLSCNLPQWLQIRGYYLLISSTMLRSSRVVRASLTASAGVASVMGSIPASSDIVESEGRQM